MREISMNETERVPVEAWWRPVGRVARFTGSRWRTLPVLMAGTFLIVLDFFIVNVAAPSMQAGLGMNAGELEWVLAGYGLTFAGFLVTAGRIGDRIGRRRVFAVGLVLFVAASTACGLAADPVMLIVARLVQGLGAALLSPTVLAIIGVTYRGPDRARAISVYGIVMGLAAAGGQVLGGLLIHADIAGLGWRTVFLLNVPVGLAALAVTRRLVPESRAEHRSRLDVVGMALLTAGLTALLLPLVQGRQAGWPAWAWACLAAAPVLFGLLVGYERRVARRGGKPVLDGSLFRVRAFAAGLACQLVFFAGMVSFFLVLALYLQLGRGLDALEAGLVFTILAAAYLVTSLRAAALTLRYGRTVIRVGAVTVAAGTGLLLAAVTVVGTGGSLWWLVPGLAGIGAGQGLCITPLTTTVLAHADAQRAGLVSGALSTMQQAGNALGVAVTGVVFFSALPGGYGHAFAASLLELACLPLAVAALTWLLPRSRPPVPG
jgi:EmrB/QacA subfamily drug resistance transporter